MTVEQIVREVKALPETEQAQLMDVLRMEIPEVEDSDVLRAQVALAEERLAAYDRGEDTAIDADEMLAKLRQKYLQ